MKGERSKRARARQLVFSVTILWAILLPNANSGTDGDAETRSQDRQLPSRVISAPFSLELVWIPQGRFRMGDITGSGQADERPLREVAISGFWMMRTEVTRGMFARFVEDAGHDTGNRCWVHDGGWSEKDGLDWKAPGFVQSDGHPVTCVNWHDAQAFIAWLNHKSGEAFRLPSEAEWEYAARAGSESVYYMGDDPSELCAHANAADKKALEHYPGFAVNNCDDGYVRTSPVASLAASPWGLYDIYGNVWEWVEDCWRASYAGAPSDGSAVLEGDCTRRGFRGGGYGDIPHYARSTLRNRGNAAHRKDDIGFRLVITGPDTGNPAL
jgi:formylglycine-generating enzyme required for sulfatase activity